MFYINFTSPEGKTYRIDIAKHPVHFECPVCGDLTVYTFEEDNENSCFFCKEKKQNELNDQLYRRYAHCIDHRLNSHITQEEAKRIIADPSYQSTLQALCDNPKIKLILPKK